jgi:hypothetical protein
LERPKSSKPQFRKGQRESRFERWQKLLNSPIIIWSFSAVFLSFGSWVYTTWSQARSADRARLEKIERLDAEIAHRFRNATGGLPLATVVFISGEESYSEHLAEGILLPPKPEDQLYPQYAKYNVAGLVSELSFLLQGSERDCVLEALSLIEAFSMKQSARVHDGTKPIPTVRQIYLLRWAGTSPGSSRKPPKPVPGVSPALWCVPDPDEMSAHARPELARDSDTRGPDPAAAPSAPKGTAMPRLP